MAGYSCESIEETGYACNSIKLPNSLRVNVVPEPMIGLAITEQN
jgi:hypothetical protein